MQAVVTGDWHIGASAYGVVDEFGNNSRLDDLESVINRMIDFAVRSKVDLFVQAGDVFHTNRPTVAEQLCFWRILNRLQQSGIPSVRFIIGNHDYSSKLGENHALKLFKSLCDGTNTTIYDETTWEQFGDLLVCFHPYKGVEPDWLVVGQKNCKATALVCHSHLEGAVVGAEPFEIKDDSCTQFKHLMVNHVWAGHFHKPQVLSDVPLAFYPGSPVAVDFSERFDVKGCVLVDVFSGKYKTVGFKSRQLHQIDLTDTVAIPNSELKKCCDAIVKVVISLDESQTHEFDEQTIRDALLDAGAHSIATVQLKVRRSAAVRDSQVNLDSSLTGNFKQYIQSKDYGVRLVKVLDYGDDIIKSCVS